MTKTIVSGFVPSFVQLVIANRQTHVFGRTRQIRTADLYHVKIAGTYPRNALYLFVSIHANQFSFFGILRNSLLSARCLISITKPINREGK